MSAKNKLDPYAARIADWVAEGMEQKVMREELRKDGLTVSASSLSVYISRMQDQADQERLFGLIATGGQMNAELDAAFKKNPAPGIDRLIQVTQSLVMSLQIKGVADPKLLSLANSMQQTVLNFVSGQTKAELEHRKLDLQEQKFQVVVCEKFLEWFKDEKARGIAESSVGNAEKIEALRREYFKDVDALEQSGQVKLPE